MKNRIVLVLALALLVPGLAMAQEDAKKPQDDAVASWVTVLIKNMGNDNEVVTRSVDRALVAVGEPAIPALKKVADSDGQGADRAKRIIEQIENPRGRFGRGGRGAGGEGGGAGGGGRGFGRDPFQGIELSTEQKTKVEKIQATNRSKMQELFESMRSGDMDRSEMRGAMQELQEQMNTEVKKVLNEDQYKQYEQNSQRRGRRRGGDG